jgi:hypothetical protein
MKFERGRDPKEAMGLGLEGMVKEVNGIIVRAEDFTPVPKTIDDLEGGIRPMDCTKPTLHIPPERYRDADVIVAIVGDKYKLIKNRYWLIGIDDQIQEEGNVSDIPELVEVLKKANLGVQMPNVQQIAAKTIGMDLVPVQPMSAPSGQLFHLDYVYGNENKKNAVRKRKGSKRGNGNRSRWRSR